MEYAICHKKHMFEKCPILSDIPFVKKHFILYCIFVNFTQEQMMAIINLIDVT